MKAAIHLPGLSLQGDTRHRAEACRADLVRVNWRGRPLTSHEVIVNTIGATTTAAGLTVQAELDEGIYPKGIKIPDREMKDLEKTRITRDRRHGEWNYTIHPATTNPEQDHPIRDLDSS